MRSDAEPCSARRWNLLIFSVADDILLTGPSGGRLTRGRPIQQPIARLSPLAEQSFYTFDLSDDWTHLYSWASSRWCRCPTGEGRSPDQNRGRGCRVRGLLDLLFEDVYCAGDDQSQGGQCDQGLSEHGQFGPPGQWHDVSGAKGGGVGE